MPVLNRLTLTLMISGGLLLAGCAQHQETRATPMSVKGGSASSSADTAHRAHRPSSVVAAEGADNDSTSLPRTTGIPACDDYLSSYIGCHQAAQIYAPGQLPSRYQAMRNSLLRDSQNPDIRPQLAARCNSLANQLREALHGKACTVSPAPSSSSP
ncbi:MAG: hypothetical protein WC617_00075 [Rhodanobacter sp.]|jgi:hypothetical protein